MSYVVVVFSTKALSSFCPEQPITWCWPELFREFHGTTPLAFGYITWLDVTHSQSWKLALVMKDVQLGLLSPLLFGNFRLCVCVYQMALSFRSPSLTDLFPPIPYSRLPLHPSIPVL